MAIQDLIEDGERKGSEGARPKVGDSSRKFGGTKDEDYDNPDEEYDDDDEGDYYGDETTVSLSSVSTGARMTAASPRAQPAIQPAPRP